MSKKPSKRYTRSIQIPASLHADFRAKVKSQGQNLNFVIGILIANYIATPKPLSATEVTRRMAELNSQQFVDTILKLTPRKAGQEGK